MPTYIDRMRRIKMNLEENNLKADCADRRKPFKACLYALGFTAAMIVSGCKTEQVFTSGATLQDETVALVPVGSSREQVLLALGSPSTTGTFENEEVFYYISQKRKKTFEFQKAKLVSQRVFSVYFNSEDTVERLADYGMQDGKVFDFITRTTPTGGADKTFLARLFSGGQAAPALPGG